MSMKRVLPSIVFLMVFSTVGMFSLTASATSDKINICHKSGDDWNFMDTPAGESLDGHLGHGDFLYTGPEGEGSDEWCEENAPDVPEEETATISALKIVCPTEDLLPNWGDGGPDITSTTASDFLVANPTCELEPWTFEWAPSDTSNPGDNATGNTGGTWTTFGDTIVVPAGARIWVREQFVEGYVPFTGANTTEDVSAELYCYTDVLNYDNYDWIDPVEAGGTYHCIGFNVPTEPETPTGTLTIQKYDCPADFVPNRDNHGVGSVVPAGCTPEAGVGFEYTYDPNNSTNNTGPYLGLFGDPTSFSPLNLTDANGFSVNEGMDSPGRYIIRETDSTNLLGLYCVGDGDTNPNNNDNQEITFVPEDNDDLNCVAYNIETDEPDPEPLVCEAGVNLLANGSFENPEVTNGALWDIFPSGTPTLAWLVAWINPSGAPDIANAELQKDSLLGVTASDGTQWTELDSDFDGPSGSLSGEAGAVSLTQTTPTIPGETYEVSFDFMPRPDVAGAESKIEALYNATIGATVDASAGASWTNHLFSFIAPAGPSTGITFRDALGNPNNSVGTLLDNVRVECVPEQTPCEEVLSSQTVVSDDTTNDGNGNASELTFVHPAWTASIPGATWIWATDPVEAPTNDGDLTKTFTKTFTVAGTPTGGTLNVAADNSYSVVLNGNPLPVIFDQNNFQLATQDSYDVSAFLVNGLNTLEITVTNWESAEQSADPASNPAGLLYKLSLDENACVPPEPETAEITVVKVTEGGFGAFEFSGIGDGFELETTEGENSDSETFEVPADTYVITENVPEGWDLDIYCEYDEESVGVEVPPNGKEVTVYPGDEVTCTFTNTKDDVPPPDTATISAVKIVCPTEDLLPNWGDNDPDFNLTPNTATRFLNANPSCHTESWTFEWAPNGTGNPGDNTTGETGEAWTEFLGSVEVPAGALVWVREQVNSNYVPFSGDTSSEGGWDDVSAELYCNTDVLNYDNFDWIDPVVAGEIYYCIGFNAPVTVDVCLDVPGNQTSTEECSSPQALPQCSDDTDNTDGEDTLSDENDPGCHTDGNPDNSGSYDPNDNDESNSTSGPESLSTPPEEEPPVHRTQGQFNRPSGGGSSGGAVLGTSCGLYMDKFIRAGRNNDPEQVKKLQQFLNDFENAGLPVTGVYGPLTVAAVKAFQIKYADEILTPWGENVPTGIVYQTTLRQINMIVCADLALEIPALIPWSKNPNIAG